MGNLSKPSVVIGLLVTAFGLFLVARSDHRLGVIAATVVLVVLFLGFR